ncbi:MAG: hypothetical protein KDA36_12115, partial [Planctomycetaceae bacterium]|nr:hypothetical protein [Planctomycetaceae bacterium]
MGQEIADCRFKHYDFHRFRKMLSEELEILRQWFHDERFSARELTAGLELEAWIVDATGHPLPWNDRIIELAEPDTVVPELSKFNVEFNVDPRPLADRGLSELAAELESGWHQLDTAANQLGASITSIGVLPSITDSMLSLANMSNLHRYRALNEQVLRLRQGNPIRLDIAGPESLLLEHRDVMLESAATSFQLHLQVPLRDSVRYYNAAIIASAPLVAIAANSPFLFGHRLWEETRIPLFEQAVDAGRSPLPRVTFGSGYASNSLFEIFSENDSAYPILLPLTLEDSSARLVHLRLHNGTIWRWNRPLIGFDEDGTPHLRVEQRVMAAGPTVQDMTANMALYYGLVENLAHAPLPPESRLPFAAARDNFYAAARDGLECRVKWLQDGARPLGELLLTELLPRATAGL